MRRTRTRLALALLAPPALLTCLLGWRLHRGAPEAGPPAPADQPAAPADQPPAPADQPAARADQPAAPADQAAARADARLDWADAEGRRQVDVHLGALGRFFDDARRGEPAFAAEVLGLRGRLCRAVDRLPLTRPDRHQALARTAFARHLFTPGQLARAVDEVVRGYQAELDDVEGRMLLRLGQDLAGLPPGARPAWPDATAWAAARARARGPAPAGLPADLAVLLDDDPLAGLGGALAGPGGRLARAVGGRLDELHRALVEGDGRRPGLRRHLEGLARARSASRRAAVRDLQTAGRGVHP